MLNRTITAVKLHEGLFISGPGDLGNTFPSPSGGGKTVDNLKFESNEIGVIISGRRVGVSYSAATVFSVLVPWTMVKQATLKIEESNETTSSG